MHNHHFTPTSGASKLTMPFLLIMGVAMLIYLKLGFVFMLLAVLPSGVAYAIDRLPGKPSFKTVLACNIATAIHPVFDLYSHGVNASHTRFSDAMANPQVWLFIYIGAAAGWGLVYACHFLAHFTVKTYHEYQLYHLQQQQEWLVAEWGKEIVPVEED